MHLSRYKFISCYRGLLGLTIHHSVDQISTRLKNKRELNFKIINLVKIIFVMEEDYTYVYIMGRGHSGSTFLNALLGNGQDATAIGELVAGIKIERLDDQCSCGESIRNCEFWNDVRAVFENDTGITWAEASRAIRNQAHIFQFLPTLASKKDSDEVKYLTRITEGLIKSIGSVAEKKFVIDSSKEITRALFLNKFTSNVKIIHLVRNPQNMLASNLERIRNGTGFAFLRRRFKSKRLAPLLLLVSSINWCVGNLLCHIVKYVDPEKVIRIRYEDLIADPESQMNRIADFTGIDLQGVQTHIKSRSYMEIDHKLTGSGFLKEGKFKFDPRKGDKKLSPGYKLMTNIVCWPFMKLYGYKMF